MGLIFDDAPPPIRKRPTLEPIVAPATLAPKGRPRLEPQDKPTAAPIVLPPKREGRPYLAKPLPLLDGARGYAEFSEDHRLRYILKRDWWDENKDRTRDYHRFSEPYVCFIGMNPSVAGALEDDKTIRMEIEFTRRLGYASYHKVNLFPLCATDPDELDREENRAFVFGEIKNEITLINDACGAAMCVAAWGSLRGKLREYAVEITRRLMAGQQNFQFYSYGVTQDGSPRHTSRLSHDTVIEPWEGYPNG